MKMKIKNQYKQIMSWSKAGAMLEIGSSTDYADFIIDDDLNSETTLKVFEVHKKVWHYIPQEYVVTALRRWVEMNSEHYRGTIRIHCATEELCRRLFAEPKRVEVSFIMENCTGSYEEIAYQLHKSMNDFTTEIVRIRKEEM